MTIELRPDVDQERFMADIEAAAAQAGVRIDAQRWSEHTLSAPDRGGMELVAWFRHLFMTVIVLMCATIVANTVAKGINERVRELSTVRAFGFRRSDVTRLIAMEGAMLSVVACGVGLAVTLLIAYGITAAGFRYHAGFLSIPINLRIVLAPDMWALSTVALIALSAFTAWLCAKRVARRKIAEGLAHVA
jgi:ABC-type lipoprotein release transport system permease subunit